MSERQIVLAGYRGSVAHNLHIPREADDVFGIDDVDTFEVYVHPLAHYLGFGQYLRADDHFERKVGVDDDVSYSLHKFVYLAAQGNPNVLPWLWTRAEHYNRAAAAGQMLIANRRLFLGKRRVREAFVGYAMSQLKRLEHGAYEGYMGEKRKKLVDLYGYDCKNGVNLIKLLRQGREVLETGGLIVYREADRDELLAIKTGQVPLADLKALAESEKAALEVAYEHSPLPEKTDHAAIDRLLQRCLVLTLDELAGVNDCRLKPTACPRPEPGLQG